MAFFTAAAVFLAASLLIGMTLDKISLFKRAGLNTPLSVSLTLTICCYYLGYNALVVLGGMLFGIVIPVVFVVASTFVLGLTTAALVS